MGPLTEAASRHSAAPATVSPARLGRWTRVAWPAWVIRAAVVFGAVVRIRNWAHDRSLWLDELLVATNIVQRDFAGLAKPLDANQAAPVGWLWIERAALDVFGSGELSLRLFPLLAGLAGLVAFAWLAGRALPGPGAALAVVLVACCPSLIYYANEVKQYGSDAAATVVVLLAAALLTRRRPGPRRMLAYALLCVALLWVSFPALVVALGATAVLLVRWVRRPVDVLVFAPAGCLVLAGAGWEYVATLRALAKNAYLDTFWQNIGGYPPPGGSALRWLHHDGSAVLRYPGDLSAVGLAALLLACGLVTLLRSDPWVGVLVALPVVIAPALALTRHYPMHGRLALFAVPSVLLLLAAGAVGVATALVALARRVSRAGRPAVLLAAAVAVALVGVTAGELVRTGADRLVTPDEVTAGRQAVAFISAHQRPGDLVLVEQPWATPTLDFYGPRFGVHAGGTFGVTPACRADRLDALAGRPRVWVLFAHQGSDEPGDRTGIFLSHLEQGSTPRSAYSGAGQAGAYLLDFTSPPATPPPLRPLWSPTSCVAATVRPV